jgi:predicted phage terminase large subunit-like protein
MTSKATRDRRKALQKRTLEAAALFGNKQRPTAEAISRYAFPHLITRERPSDRAPLLPHQVPPPGDWTTWVLMGGRGSGKTEAGADYFDKWMVEHPGHRGRIIAPSQGDAFESCVDGPSGLLSINPEIKRLVSAPGGAKLVWPNGSECLIMGTHSPGDVERLRATGNRHIDWWEEAGANRHLQAAWDQAAFGLRLGDHPHRIVTTTPKPTPALRGILKLESTVITRGTINDNPHLIQSWKDELIARYKGTRIGRQELDGELLLDIPGALWTWEMIDNAHTSLPVPMVDCVRVIVGVDPATTAKRESDDTGIIVCGKGADGRGYVLDDRSCHLSPDGWAKRAVAAYDTHSADRIVAEVNNGGDLVETVIRTVRQTIAYKKVTASRGKAIRAEPVAALYEQGRISHVRPFNELEQQLTEWSPDDGTSPDRLDALVWAMTDLNLFKARKVWTMV